MEEDHPDLVAVKQYLAENYAAELAQADAIAQVVDATALMDEIVRRAELYDDPDQAKMLAELARRAQRADEIGAMADAVAALAAAFGQIAAAVVELRPPVVVKTIVRDADGLITSIIEEPVDPN